MKKTKADLWVFFCTFFIIVLGAWLVVIAQAAARHEKRIEELTKTNQELRADLEELREDQEKIRKNEQTARAEILDRVERLEKDGEELDGYISRIYTVLTKLTRKKTQEAQKEKQVAQIDTEADKTATWSSYEVTEASQEYTETPAPDVSPDGLRYVGTYNLTAYPWTDDPCADEVYPEEGFTAACNNPELWHKWVYIEGVGERYIHDTGDPSVMGYDTIDIFIYDRESCIQFGRQSGAVYVIE